jgi:hypothetical protein
MPLVVELPPAVEPLGACCANAQKGKLAKRLAKSSTRLISELMRRSLLAIIDITITHNE